MQPFKAKKGKAQAQELRKKALERLGETQKRKANQGEEHVQQKKHRTSGSEAIAYLRQRAEENMKLKVEEQQAQQTCRCHSNNNSSKCYMHFISRVNNNTMPYWPSHSSNSSKIKCFLHSYKNLFVSDYFLKSDLSMFNLMLNMHFCL